MAVRRFNPNQRPRGKLKQYGSNNPYFSLTRAVEKKLRTYEDVTVYDTTISSTLDLLCESLISSLGPIEHSDEKVQEFLRDNNQYIIDNHLVDPCQEMKQVIKNTLWAGFSVTEVLYEKFQGLLGLQGYAQYHPTTITLRTNYKGQLTEGEATPDEVYTSGIWQRIMHPYHGGQNHTGEVRLPMDKTILLSHQKSFNNYYGRSIIEGCYRWHVLKESLLDMFLIAQDQHGNPMTVITVPNSASGEYEVDPYSGEEKQLSVMQTMERQLSSTSSQEGNTMMIPFTDKDKKPEVKVLSTSSDVAQGYLDAIRFCDEQIIRSLLVPHTLVDSSQQTSNGDTAERDMEMFNRTIHSLYKSFVVPFVNKSYGNIVRNNFGVEEMPTMPLRNIMRPEDRVSMMQFIRGLTELTYLNPKNEVDRHMVRSWVGAIEREWSSEDAEFFERYLLDPIEKTEGGSSSSSGNKQSSNATPTNRESRSNTRDRKKEGKTKGSGKPGRPTGKSTPNVRDKQGRSSAKA